MKRNIWLWWRWLGNRTWRKWRTGFNPEEFWSLDYTFVAFMLPRLKHFRTHYADVSIPGCLHTYDDKWHATDWPGAQAKWESILDEMIEGFELLLADDYFEKEKQKKLDKSWELLGKYAQALWW